MQGAKLEVDNKHSRGSLGANDVVRELERIHGGIAAHESDHGTFDRARKPAALDEFEIEAGRGKASATGYKQMGDAVERRCELQPIDRGLRWRRRVLFEQPYARRRVGETAARVEAFRVQAIAFGQIAWREARVAVLDPRLAGHALEQQRIAPVMTKQRLCEAAKGVMNVVGRHRRRDAIDVCCLQRTILRAGLWALLRWVSCDGRVMSHRARERTPADRDHCGRHKIVIIASGTMMPISFAAFWTLGTVSEIATGIDERAAKLFARNA